MDLLLFTLFMVAYAWFLWQIWFYLQSPQRQDAILIDVGNRILRMWRAIKP